MYLRWSRRHSAQSIHARLLALTVSVVAVAGATGANAQSADDFAASELPPLEVETSQKKKVVKKRPNAEPQVPVAQASGSSAGTTDATVSHTANNTPTDAAKVGSSVVVLTEKDLNAQSKIYLKDYLQQVTGVNFSQNGPPGTMTRISVRGVSMKYVKMLVDGIDVSDPSGTTTVTHFEHLMVGDVSRIEVLKGSQSTLYGGDAIGGVISIQTKAATKPGFFQSGSAEYGTYNTYNGNYTAGYATTDGSNIALSVQGVNTDGFSAYARGTEDDGYRNLTLSGRGTYRVSDAVSLFFAGRTTDARYHYDGGFPLQDADNYGDFAQHAGRAGMEVSLLGGAFVNTFAIQGMTVTRDLYEGGTDSFYDGDRIKGEYKGVLSINERLAFLAGADWERTSISNSNITYSPSADIAGVYAQLMMEPIDGLLLTGGGRVDEHSEFGRFNTYRLTGAYQLPGTETKFRGSLATGFRAPALDEMFGLYPGIPYYGNTALTPEESKSWDVGIDQGFQRGRYLLSATYFEIDTENAIIYDWTGCTAAVPCMVNVPGITNRRGVELSAAAQVTDYLAVSAGYTYTDTEIPSGARLPFVPKHSLVLGLDVKPIDKVELNVVGQYVANTFQSATVNLDDYFLLSAKASYEFTPGWKAYVRGENLLDEKYQTIANYGTAGLTVFGGIQMAMPAN
ncbi:TonB-dependent receptor [Hyphomicrobium sp. D-2]|uniref:TonB-dependent receptor plug domain-containing protein n=1 Tax=Hyphomicrobium sp. D-2 TaxID=3041621 RepID=UPI002455A0A3|nr:TonB-dependent receptor [Hyphomicrobium sp. D-2]MDH4983075.1 TonB-dependent receptor [Hyphomicrobium sp. D-2]